MRPFKWLRDLIFGAIPDTAWRPIKPQDWICPECYKIVPIDHDANRPEIYKKHRDTCNKEYNFRYIIDEDYGSPTPRFTVSYCELIWSYETGHCVWKKHDSCVVSSEDEGHQWAQKNYPFAGFDPMIGA